MKNINNSSSTKSIKNKDMNQPNNNDIDIRVKNLENLVKTLNSQIEFLSKKIDDLETRNSNVKSVSTINNTISDEDEINSIKNINEFKIKDTIENNEITVEINKRVDIIKSNIDDIEIKLEGLGSEFSNLRSNFENNIDNTKIIKRGFEKFERSERLISELSSQINNMKVSNIQYQSEFLKNLNDFNEKILFQELIKDQHEKSEKSMNKRIDNLCTEFGKIYNLLKQHDEQNINLLNDFKFYEEKINIEILNLKNKAKDDMQKVEVNMKALWDSLALFTSNDNYI